MKKIFLSSMFVVAAVAMVTCAGKKEVKQEEVVVELPKVEVQQVENRDVVQQAVFTGTVEAQVVNNIAPQQPLRIKKIRYDVGDHVRAMCWCFWTPRRSYRQRLSSTTPRRSMSVRTSCMSLVVPPSRSGMHAVCSTRLPRLRSTTWLRIQPLSRQSRVS